MANNCNTNLFQDSDPNTITSNSVIWQGGDIECLGICNGIKLTPLVSTIVTSICQILEDIDISSVELCPEFITKLGTRDKNIANLFQVLLDYNCSLIDLLADMQDQIDIKQQITVNLKCLQPTPETDPCNDYSDLTLNSILQIIIDAFCKLREEYDEFVENIYANIEELIDTKIQENNTTIISQTSIPQLLIFAYNGPLTNFDSTGKGLVGGLYEKYAICNGNNGTPDYRGFVLPMAIQGMGGGALDSLVDPVLNPATPTSNYSVGSKGGRVLANLTVANIPSHNHSVNLTDPGHSHTVQGIIFQDSPDFGNGGAGMDTWTAVINTSISTTGISVSINNTGGSQPHENRMPYKATVYIQKIA